MNYVGWIFGFLIAFDACVVGTTLFALNTILSFRIAKGAQRCGQISGTHDGGGWKGTLSLILSQHPRRSKVQHFRLQVWSSFRS